MIINKRKTSHYKTPNQAFKLCKEVPGACLFKQKHVVLVTNSSGKQPDDKRVTKDLIF